MTGWRLWLFGVVACAGYAAALWGRYANAVPQAPPPVHQESIELPPTLHGLTPDYWCHCHESPEARDRSHEIQVRAP